MEGVGWGAAGRLCVCILSVGCSVSTSGLSPSKGADAGARSDGAPNVFDAGSSPDGGPLVLDGVCNVNLMPVRGPAPSTGTLPAPGPYRPCDVVGGQSFSALVTSADGRRVAALGVGGQIQVLDAGTLALVATFTRARGGYTALAISANGARLAAGAERDGELDVWSVDDQALLLAAELGPTWPTFGGAVAISADGTRAAASSGPDTVVADVGSGALRRYAEQRTCCTNALFFVDGDRKLASARYGFTPVGSGNANVALIDLDTGAETLLTQYNDIYGVEALVVSADGATLLTSRDRIRVWDAATGQKRVELASPGLAGLALLGLDADGAELALAGESGSGLLFQRRRASDGALVDQLPLPILTRVLGWSPAGLFVSTAATVLTAVDVRALRVRARACSAPTVDVAAFSRDGARLLDRSIPRQHVLDAASGAPIGPVTGDNRIASVAMSPDGRWLAWMLFPPSLQTTPSALQVEVVDVDRRTRATLVGATADARFQVTLAFSADSARLAALDGYNGILDVFDLSDARLIGEQPLPRDVVLLGFTDDGEAVRFDQEVAVVTMRWRDGAVLASWPYLPDGYLAASSDGGTFVVTTDGRPGMTTVYREGTPIETLPGTGYDCFGGGSFVAASPGGGVVGVGFGCSRPWFSAAGPRTTIYETTADGPVQTLPVGPPVFSWDGDRFAEGAVIWCR